MKLKDYIIQYNCTKEEIFFKDYLNKISENVSGEKNVWYNHNGKYSPFSKNNSNITEEQRLESIKKAVKNRDNSCNNTHLEYWLKKCNGDEKLAKECLRNRQSTFSLKKCIEKYGEEVGLKRFNERQEKWLKNYKKQNFSNISQNLFKNIYEKINNKYKEIYFATLKNNEYDLSGKNN